MNKPLRSIINLYHGKLRNPKNIDYILLPLLLFIILIPITVFADITYTGVYVTTNQTNYYITNQTLDFLEIQGGNITQSFNGTEIKTIHIFRVNNTSSVVNVTLNIIDESRIDVTITDTGITDIRIDVNGTQFGLVTMDNVTSSNWSYVGNYNKVLVTTHARIIMFFDDPPPTEPTLSIIPDLQQNELDWIPPTWNGGSPITGYKVYRDTSPNAGTLLTTLGNVTTYTDSFDTIPVPYYYRVKATSGLGDSLYSNEVSGLAAIGPEQKVERSCGEAVSASWTMIGILPVILFFLTFSLFSAMDISGAKILAIVVAMVGLGVALVVGTSIANMLVC